VSCVSFECRFEGTFAFIWKVYDYKIIAMVRGFQCNNIPRGDFLGPPKA